VVKGHNVTPHLKNKTKRVGSVAQVVALSSNPSIAKKKKKKIPRQISNMAFIQNSAAVWIRE
jgi:hypothetical protein